MKKIILWGVFLFSLTFLVGCEDDNDPFVGSDNFITSFKLKQGENSYEALLRGDTIILATPDGVVLSEVTPDIVCSENSSIKPDPSTITNWEEQIYFVVTSHSGAERRYLYVPEKKALTFEGIVMLNTQEEVDAFGAKGLTRIDGSLIIGRQTGRDTIRSLEALSTLKRVTSDITINQLFMGYELTGLDNLEEVLITSDVGVETTVRIIERIEERVQRDKYMGVDELNRVLKEEIVALLKENTVNDAASFELPENGVPYVIMVVGVNGVGKTTTIGKLAYKFKEAGKKVVLGAADTFRAAAVDQLVIWADRVGVPIVKQAMGADPASVAYDTLSKAKADGADVVIIDTAGRLHNKINLMNELTKIKNVMKKVLPEAPNEVLLVLDGSTGQNAYEQAKQFTLATEVNALAITKLDGTAKGGVVIGISDQFKIPVKYIGIGEKIEDLQVFNREEFVDSLFS